MLKRLGLVLLGLALAAALVGGGWLLARAQGQRAQAALRDTVAVLTGDLVTQVHRAEDLGATVGELSDSAGVWSDSVRVLVARIRARSTRPASSGGLGSGNDGIPESVNPGFPTSENAEIPDTADLTPALVEACSQLATRCDLLRDSVAVLVDSVQGLGLTVRRFATTLDSALAETAAPAPTVQLHTGGFSTGLAVGAGGTAALALTLILLFGR